MIYDSESQLHLDLDCVLFDQAWNLYQVECTGEYGIEVGSVKELVCWVGLGCAPQRVWIRSE